VVIAGAMAGAADAKGVLVALGHTRAEGLKGLAVSAYNRVEGCQTGCRSESSTTPRSCTGCRSAS
jgi:hypothetical protein